MLKLLGWAMKNHIKSESNRSGKSSLLTFNNNNNKNNTTIYKVP